MPLPPDARRGDEDEAGDADAQQVVAGQQRDAREVEAEPQREREGVGGEERAEGRGDDGDEAEDEEDEVAPP